MFVLMLYLQDQGSQSQCVCDVAQQLVDDFCLLYPDIKTSFKKLPAVSTLFTCNFITALTTIYTYTGKLKLFNNGKKCSLLALCCLSLRVYAGVVN